MSQTEESRLNLKTDARHHDGRPFHFGSLSQDDRIRRVFGLSAEESLPNVNDQTLTVYFAHLAENLSMPFEAMHSPTNGDARQLFHYVRVTELLDPSHDRVHNNLYGLFCKVTNAKGSVDIPLADLGVRDDNPNCQLLDDYAYWFVNWR